jgi:putative FmdB family regulatory protein
MPRYGYVCDLCGTMFDLNLRLADYTPVADCPNCGDVSRRIFEPPYVIHDIKPYYDRGLGAWVQSRQDRKAIMRSRGLVEADSSSAREAEEILGEQYDKENRRPPKAN